MLFQLPLVLNSSLTEEDVWCYTTQMPYYGKVNPVTLQIECAMRNSISKRPAL